MKIDPRTVSSAITTPLSQEQKQERETNSLHRVCEDFEAIFLHTLFKAMRKTVPENSLFEENSAEEMYRDMLDMEMADTMAKTQSIGIAQRMYEQMEKQLSKK